jgi:metal-responsive CopG/Arc/MetJ family transcriptional regulator
MKTAISLPDPLFAAADKFARRKKLSRSELYARALEEYLARHRDSEITERLNDVHAEETRRTDPAFHSAQVRGLKNSEW